MSKLEDQDELDVRYMREAIKQAINALDKDEVPIGAVIVHGKTIIAKGFNQTETLNDVTAHAEMIAFTAASSFVNGKYLNECTLYVPWSHVQCAQVLLIGRKYHVLFMAPPMRKEDITSMVICFILKLKLRPVYCKRSAVNWLKISLSLKEKNRFTRNRDADS